MQRGRICFSPAGSLLPVCHLAWVLDTPSSDSELVHPSGHPARLLLSIGWGGGLLSKTAWLDKDTEEHRKILGILPLYSRAISTGMPFPKTRRIVFQENKPATLPGWVLLEVG